MPVVPAFKAIIAKQWIMRVAFVPAAVIRSLGGWQPLGKGGKGVPVVARYAGEAFETTVSPGGAGRGRLVLQMKVLRRLKLDAGDEVRIELERTRNPGEPSLPDDLRRALQLRPAARRYFDDLTPSARRWVVRHLEDARSPQTRVNRIERMIEAFAEHDAERKAKARESSR